MTFTLSADQEKAVEKLRCFLRKKDVSQFLLEGYAGTGKTTILQFLLNHHSFHHLDICFSATTNKAVSVMKQMKSNFKSIDTSGSRHFKTIHKLLSLKRDIQYDGNIQWVLQDSNMNRGKSKQKNEKFKRLVDYDLVVIDEASMINIDMFQKIISILSNKNVITKLIWVGDRAQLPPVNEDTSPVFTSLETTEMYYLLTEVKRNHNETIYDFQSVVRELTNKQQRLNLTKFKQRQEEVFTIIKKDEKRMLDSYFSMLNQNKPSIVLAYSNACVNRYNTMIRNKLRELRNLSNSKKPYIEGEIILFNNFYKGDKIVFYTSEQAKVISVRNSYVNISGFDSYINEQFVSHIDTFHENCDKPDIVDTMKNENKNDTCPICLDAKVSFKKTVCGHLFCVDCIREWLDVNKSCPLCRMVIRDNRIYLSNSELFNKLLDEFYDLTAHIELEVYSLDVVPEVGISPEIQKEYQINDTISVCKDKKQYDKICKEVSDKIKEIANFVFKRLKGKKNVQKMFLSTLWKYYYENFVDSFADITYGYCITTHKSQGSTYENCYVVMSNILTACPKYKDAIRSLYTSVTRPSKSLTLYY